MYAIVDIENFYVSAERLFDPSLRKVPVCVLSNGDGCCVARSEEAKALHIKMGAPVLQNPRDDPAPRRPSCGRRTTSSMPT